MLTQAHVKEAQDIVQGGGGGPKIKFGYALFALLALAVPATVLLLGQQQDIRQRASGPENVIPQGAIKQVGSSYITNADVDSRLQQLYGTDSAKFKDDITIRQTILDQLIRDRVIQQEAAKQNITVTDKEIDDKARELGLTAPFDRTKILNTVIEAKLKNKVVAWKKIDYLITYKEAAPTSPIVVSVKKILSSVKTDLDNGKSVNDAWQASGQATTALGKTFSVINNAIVYNDSFNKSVSDKLFSYKSGQVTDVIDSGGGVFIVAKILDSNDSQYKTFDEWYNAAKTTYVK